MGNGSCIGFYADPPIGREKAFVTISLLNYYHSNGFTINLPTKSFTLTSDVIAIFLEFVQITNN